MRLYEERARLDARKSELSGSIFSNVNLSGSTFENVNFSGASFDDANMSRVAGSRCELVGTSRDQGKSGRRRLLGVFSRRHDNRWVARH